MTILDIFVVSKQHTQEPSPQWIYQSDMESLIFSLRLTRS